MFDVFTSYLLYGLVAGLVLSLILFRFWNLPSKLKSVFKLNTRTKTVLFVILMGFAVAVVVTVLVGIVGLPVNVGQVVEGIGVGFSCAVVVGLLNTSADEGKKTGVSGTKTANRRTYEDNKGRRSKG